MKTFLAIATLLMFGASAVVAEIDPVHEDMIGKGDYEGTPWLSGGVGEGEREYIVGEYADDYNLKLEFADAQGSYLADIEVQIATPTGEVVMNTVSNGPWFMTKLPAGKYKVVATGTGGTLEKTVEIPAKGLHTVVFNDWAKAEVTEEKPSQTN